MTGGSMLHRITTFDAIDQRQLMDIYQESNKENTMEFYHGRPRADAVRRTAHISSMIVCIKIMKLR